MKITILSLFPEMFEGVFSESILRRAIANHHVDIQVVNFRDFATDRHHTVDDSPFGGGAGMLLKAPPLCEAVEAALAQTSAAERTRVALMTPQGRRFNQVIAQELSQDDHLVLICGRYEGFDDRVRTLVATDELSIGDFVMTGGEIAAMAIVDAVVRLLPGVLGNEASADGDSFSFGLLEYPQYTRPAEYRGLQVPDTLVSGDHKKVEQWRHRHALYRTWKARPDLLEQYSLSAEDNALLAKWQSGDMSDIDVHD